MTKQILKAVAAVVLLCTIPSCAATRFLFTNWGDGAVNSGYSPGTDLLARQYICQETNSQFMGSSYALNPSGSRLLP